MAPSSLEPQEPQGREWERLSPALGPATAPLPQVAPAAEPAWDRPAGPSDQGPVSSQLGGGAPSEILTKQKPGRSKPRLLWLRRSILALAVPLVTIMLAVRTVASPFFLWAEYHRPGFPADSYGFDTSERLRLGSYGLDYILNLAPDSYLAQIESQGQRAFLASEVSHMTDVKLLIIWSSSLTALVLVLALLSAWRLPSRVPGAIRSSLFAGSLLTLLLLLGLGVSALLGWEGFFTNFHQVLFPQGNWTFRASDTLIRLYPPQFWLDAAASAGTLILFFTLLLLVLTRPRRTKKTPPAGPLT